MKTIIHLIIALIASWNCLIGQPNSFIGTDLVTDKSFFIHYNESSFNWALYAKNHFAIDNSNSAGGMARMKWDKSHIELNTKLYAHASSNSSLVSISFGRWINPKLCLISGIDHTGLINENAKTSMNNLHLGFQYIINNEYSFRLNTFNLAPSKTKYRAPAHFEWIMQKSWSENFAILFPIQKTLGRPINIALDVRYRTSKKYLARVVIQPLKRSFAFEGSFLIGAIEIIIGSEYNLLLGPSPYFNFRSSLVLI